MYRNDFYSAPAYADTTEHPSLPVLTSTPKDSGYAARPTDQYSPRDDDHLTISSRR